MKVEPNIVRLRPPFHSGSLLLFLLLYSVFPTRLHGDKISFSALRTEKEAAVKDFSRLIRLRLQRESWCLAGKYCNATPCALNTCNGALGPEAKCQNEIISHCNCNDAASFIPAPSSPTSVPESNSPSPSSDGECPVRALNDIQCAAFQPRVSEHRGQLLNYERPAFHVPPELIFSKGDAHPIAIRDVSVRRDVCALKAEVESIRAIYVREKLTSWFYLGTEHAVTMTYPGHFQCRDENASDRLRSCDYNPTMRPWYITAATGDRDIVFLYDRNLGARDTLSRAFAEAVGTTDERDVLAARAFDDSSETIDWLVDDDDDDEREGDNGQYQLRHVDLEMKKRLVERIPKTGISKASNLTVALSAAFRTLRESTATTNCSRIIVILLGSDDACFASCGATSSSLSGGAACTCVSDMLHFVSEQQASLVDGNHATIIVLTEPAVGMSPRRTSHMERLASSLSCSTRSGMWHGVGKGESPQAATQAFTQVSALLQYDDGREEPNLYGTDVYLDAAGLGEMLTVSAPVYDFNGRRLVAVVGVDILLSEVVNRTGLTDREARSEIRKYSLESRSCKKDTLLDPCDAQALRFNTARSNVCAPPLVEGGGNGTLTGCFELKGKYYQKVHTEMNYDDARQYCASKAEGGSLLTISDRSENLAVTALLSEDSSWIGARVDVEGNGTLRWVNGSTVVVRGDEFGYGYEFGNGYSADDMISTIVLPLQPHGDSCVVADRRGTTHNWGLEPCSDRRPFVCEVPEKICRPGSGADVYSLQTEAAECADLDRVDERMCKGLGDAAIATARPFCNQAGSNSSEGNRFCCGSSADPQAAGIKAEQEDGQGQQVGVGPVAGGVASVLGATLLCSLGTFLWMRRPMKTGKGADGEATEDKDDVSCNDNPEGADGGDFPAPPEEQVQSETETLDNVEPTDAADVEGNAQPHEWKISINFLNLQWYNHSAMWPFQKRS